MARASRALSAHLWAPRQGPTVTKTHSFLEGMSQFLAMPSSETGVNEFRSLVSNVSIFRVSFLENGFTDIRSLVSNVSISLSVFSLFRE